jgi:hypothetical protein
MLLICNFPGCNQKINIIGRNICDGCLDKVIRYETALDCWLEREHPDLYLEDVLSWYTKCIRSKCQRDCLQEGNNICECCPHSQSQVYQSFKIENFIMPTREFISALKDSPRLILKN